MATDSCPVRSRRSQFQACPRSPACRQWGPRMRRCGRMAGSRHVGRVRVIAPRTGQAGRRLLGGTRAPAAC